MLETLEVLPGSFWAVMFLLLAGGAWALGRIRQGLGLPTLAVLGTVLAWYVSDAFYNDYANYHVTTFSADTLTSAWWQVAIFLGTFLVATPLISNTINARYLAKASQTELIFRTGRMPVEFESGLHGLLHVCWVMWAVLAVIAVLRLRGDVIYYFFPFLGEKLDPWGRAQIGGGYSALLSLAAVTQTFIAATSGVVAALARDRRVRTLALVLCALIWPYYVFDRTRNSMLAVILPAILAWVFLRLRFSMLGRLAVLGACFLAINVWFKYVIEHREGMRIEFHAKDLLKKDPEKTDHHAGLNMFEELCWINKFITSGEFEIGWGQRYISQLVNPIPRSIWPGKPLIGLDYAVARGQLSTDEGTTATIATGVIGQGVVDFGPVLGSAFAALLMGLWVSVLVRLDLRGNVPGHLPLYTLGLVVTFNMGRGISFIAAYPFVVGLLFIWRFGPKVQQVVGSSRAKAASKPQRDRLRRENLPMSARSTAND
jgi:hypothetical protein